MQYNGGSQRAWLETTRNYLISKASEVHKLLPWAESAQGQTIMESHVSYIESSGLCLDRDPQRLSRELWGYLNLALTGIAKIKKEMGSTHGDG